MTLPRRVRVADRLYTVSVTAGLRHGDDPCDGLTDTTAGTIEIDAAVAANPSHARSVFVHELFHAILHATSTNTAMGDEGEEWFIRAFSPTLVSALESAGLLEEIC